MRLLRLLSASLFALAVLGCPKPTPKDSTPPTFGGATQVTVLGDDSVRLAWDAASDDVSTEDRIGYLVFRGLSAGGIDFSAAALEVAPGTLSADVAGLAAGTTHFFVVRARDEAGNVDENTQVVSAATTLQGTIPASQVGGFTATSEVKKVVVDDATIFYALGSGGVRIDDLTDPTKVVTLGSVAVQSSAEAIAFDPLRRLLYVADGVKGLSVVDTQDLTKPKLVATFDPGLVGQAALAVSYFEEQVYLSGPTSMFVIDVSTPGAPSFVASLPIGSTTRTVSAVRFIAVDGTRAYGALASGEVVAWDASSPGLPELGRTYLGVPVGATVTGLSAQNRRVYVGNDQTGVVILDFSLPSSPKVLGNAPAQGGAVALAVEGNTLAVGSGSNQFYAYNVSNPAQPVLLTVNASASPPRAVGVSRGTAVCVYGPSVAYLNLPPFVWAAVPNATTNVPTSTPIYFDFSKPLNPATLTATTVRVSANGVAVSGTAAFEWSDRRLRFRPDAPLAVNTKYDVQLADTLADSTGRRLLPEGGVAYSFTTVPPPPLPAVPRGVVAVPGNGQNTLYWSRSSYAKRYYVYYSESPGVTQSSNRYVTLSTWFGHPGLLNGKTYHYAVSAENESGETTLSLEVSATPQLPPPPQPPPSTWAYAADQQVALNWQGVSGASQYNVYWSNQPNQPLAARTKVAFAGRPFTHSGLTNGTPYYYVVTAENAGGESGPSPEAAATPATPPPPAQVPWVSARGQDGSVALSWGATAGATSYRVYWSTVAGQAATAGTVIGPVYGQGFTHWGVTNGTPYYYVVKAFNGSTEGPASAEVSALPQVPPPPPAPTNVGTVAGDARATIYWSGSPGAYRYNLYYSTTPGVDLATATRLSSVWSPFTHAGLANNTTYFYVVTATNSGGESGPSAEVSVTPRPPPAPAAPSNVSATAEDGAVRLAWYSVPGATSYTVYFSTTPGVTRATGQPLSTGVYPYYRHTGLTNGTTYYYVVVASNSGGSSLESTQVSATPTLPPLPTQVTNLSGVARDARVDLYWGGVSNAYWYNLYWSNAPGVSTTSTKLARVGSPFAHAGLTNGTAYYYRVAAENSAGEGPLSAEVSFTPQLPAPPAAPQNLRATALDTQVALSWSGSSGAAWYAVYWSNQPGVSKATANRLQVYYYSSYTHWGLSNGTQHCYAVAGGNTGGEGALSNEVCATPTAPPAPTQAPSLSGQAQSRATSLWWTQVSGATRYNLYFANQPGVTPQTGTRLVAYGLSYYHSGLTNGTPYCYVVTAVNNGGEGPASAEQCLTPQAPPAPQAPTNLQAVGQNQAVRVTFSSVSGATRYNLYWSTQSGVTPQTGTKLSGVWSGYTHTALTNGTTYYYVLTAENDGGESPASLQAQATPQLPAPPNAPLNVLARAGNGTVTITFSASSGATSYNLYWSTTAPVTKATGTRLQGITSGFVHAGLTNGTPYYYVVTAQNAGGESSESAQVSATPNLTPPSAPGGFYATAGLGQVQLGWDSASGATGYNLYWSNSPQVSPQTGTKIVVGAQLGYTHSGLTNGTTYYYVVTAENAGGESSPSTVAYATPSAPVPQNFVATAGDSQVSLSWAATSGATGYNLYWSTTPGVTKATGTKITVGTATSYTHTALTNGTAYYYVVTATYAGNNESADSTQRTATPQGAVPQLNTPTVGNTQLILSWAAYPGATSYYLYWATSPGVSTTSNRITASSTSHTHSGLTNGTRYYYRLAAVTAGGPSGLSSEVSGVPAAVSAPSLSVTPGYRQNNLSPSGSFTGLLHYNIYWSTTSGVTPQNGTRVSTNGSWQHGGLTVGTPYYYVATAVTSSGETAPSTQQVGTPSLPRPYVSLGAGDGKVSVGGGGTTVSGYNVYRSTTAPVNKGTATKFTNPSLPFFDTGLSNGTTYHYVFSAVFPEGESDVTGSATPQASAGVPSFQAVTPGYRSIQLVITKPSAASEPTGYNIYWSTTAGVTPQNGTLIAIGRSTDYTINYRHTGLAHNTTYYYVVTAVHASGESAPTPEVQRTTTLPAPQSLSATSRPLGARLTLSNSQPGATGYALYWSTTSGVTPATGTRIALSSLSHEHTGLTAGTTHYYVATAVYPEGESTATSQSSTVPAAAGLVAPVGVSATGVHQGAYVRWNAVSGATGYNIYWSTSSTVSKTNGTKVTVGNALNHTVTGLSNGTTYYFVVTATDATTESADSARANTQPGLTAPSLGSPSVGHQVLNLYWNSISGATGYNLYWSTSPTVSPSTGTRVQVTSTSYLHTGLSNGTTYYYVVAATAGGAESNPSQVAAGTPRLDAPSYLGADPGDGQVYLNLSPASGDPDPAPVFNLYWSTSPTVSPSTGTKVFVAGRSYLHTGLTNGTAYYYVATRTDSGGTSESPPSALVSATPRLKVPTLSARRAGSNRVWLVLGEPRGYSALNVYWGTSTGVTKSTGTAIADVAQQTTFTEKSWRHDGLTAGITYYYVATATGPSGESVESAEVAMTPQAGPAGLSVNVSPLFQGFDLSWSPVTGAAKYSVYCSSRPNPHLTGSVCATSHSPTAVYVTGGRQYFAVTATLAAGETGPSNEVVAVADTAAPNAVTIAAGSADGMAFVGWTPQYGTYDSYDLYYRTSPGVTKANGTLVANARAPHALTGLTNGTPYYFMVVTRNSLGESLPSNEATATPTAATSGNWGNFPSGAAPAPESHRFLNLAVAGSTPYLSLRAQGSNGLTQARVRTYSGSSWSDVGPSSLGANADNQVNASWVASDGTNVYVAYAEASGVAQRRQVVVKQWSGSAWNRLGADFNTRNASDVGGLEVIGGVLHVLYAEQNASGVWQLWVRAWSGSAWNVVGGAVSPSSGGTLGAAALTRLGSDPVLVLSQYSPSGGTSTFEARRFTAGSWTTMSAPSSPPGSIEGLAVAGGSSVHLAYAFYDSVQRRYIARVQASSGGAFAPVGGDLNASGVTTVSRVALTTVGSTTYAALVESGSGVLPAVLVRRWSGSSWDQVGQNVNLFPGGIDSVLAMAAGSSAPFLAFGHLVSSEGFTTGDAFVRSLVP